MTRLFSSGELAQHDFPEPPWLIDPIMPLGGIVIMHGKPGVGKTQFALTLASCINQGGDFLGRWEAKQAPVVIIQADMTGQIQQLRVRAALDRVVLDETYWVAEEDGRVPQVDITQLLYQNRGLVDEIRELEPGLVLWDTLREIHNLPENASESPKAVYGAARELFPHSTHKFNHHDRKADRDPDSLGHADESFMGNQQWKGMAETTMQLRESSQFSEPKRVTFAIHKCRTAPDVARRPILLEMHPDTLLLAPARGHKNPVRARGDGDGTRG